MQNFLFVGAAVLVFVAVMLFGQFAFWEFQTRRDEESRDLSRRLGTVVDRNTSPLLRLTRSDRKGTGAQLEDLLRQAGATYGVETLYSRMAIVGAAAALLGVVLFRSPFGLVFGVAAWLPVMLVRSQAEARARKLTEQLPEGLDLVARSLQAGHGISEAIRMCAEEMPLPLAQEFGRVYEENNLGRDFRECLENLTTRNPGSFDLQIFVSSVLLQRDTGGNLVEILQNISTTIRARFMFHGKVRALTSEARFTAVILGSLPFVVLMMLVWVNPTYLRPLVDDPLGHFFAFYAVCSFSIGVFVMREISKVEV